MRPGLLPSNSASPRPGFAPESPVGAAPIVRRIAWAQQAGAPCQTAGAANRTHRPRRTRAWGDEGGFRQLRHGKPHACAKEPTCACAAQVVSYLTNPWVGSVQAPSTAIRHSVPGGRDLRRLILKLTATRLVVCRRRTADSKGSQGGRRIPEGGSWPRRPPAMPPCLCRWNWRQGAHRLDAPGAPLSGSISSRRAYFGYQLQRLKRACWL